jgi:hypothetical protein
VEEFETPGAEAAAAAPVAQDQAFMAMMNKADAIVMVARYGRLAVQHNVPEIQQIIDIFGGVEGIAERARDQMDLIFMCLNRCFGNASADETASDTINIVASCTEEVLSYLGIPGGENLTAFATGPMGAGLQRAMLTWSLQAGAEGGFSPFIQILLQGANAFAKGRRLLRQSEQALAMAEADKFVGSVDLSGSKRKDPDGDYTGEEEGETGVVDAAALVNANMRKRHRIAMGDAGLPGVESLADMAGAAAGPPVDSDRDLRDSSDESTSGSDTPGSLDQFVASDSDSGSSGSDSDDQARAQFERDLAEESTSVD